MNHNYYLFLCLLFAYMGCDKGEKQATETSAAISPHTETPLAKKEMYRAIVDELRLRETPELTGKVLTKVPFFTMLADLKQKGTTEVEVELQGEKKKGYWVKVQTKAGITGWVHSAAVELVAVVPRYQIAADADKAKVEKYAAFLATLSVNEPASFQKGLSQFDADFAKENTATCELAYTKLRDLSQKIEEKSWEWKELQNLSQNADYDKMWDTVKKAYKMDYNAYTKKIAAAGFLLDNEEGNFFITPNYDLIMQHFVPKVSPTMKAFLEQAKIENTQRVASDNGIVIPIQEVAKRMIFWENFVKQYPTFLLKNEAENSFVGLLEMLIYGLNNTPAYDYQNPTLTPEFEAAYKWLMQTHPQSKGTAAIQEVYKTYQQNGNKKTAAVEQKQKEVMARFPYMQWED